MPMANLTGRRRTGVRSGRQHASLDWNAKCGFIERAGRVGVSLWRQHIESKFDWLLCRTRSIAPILLIQKDLIHSRIFPGRVGCQGLARAGHCPRVARSEANLGTGPHTAFVARLKDIGKLP